MKYQNLNDKLIRIKLEPDDEIIESLKKFIRETGIKGGFVSGIGAGKDFEIGWFNPQTNQYNKRVLAGDFEIISLIGNINIDENNEPIIHLHICIAGDDYECFGGHLFMGIVSVTTEISLTISPIDFVRAKDPAQQILLWKM